MQGVNDLAIISLVTLGAFLAGTLLHQLGWALLNLGVLPFVLLTAWVVYRLRPPYTRFTPRRNRIMIAVGRLKLREADDLLEQARADFTDEALQDLLAIRARLDAYQHRLRLGVGHQSPDYQWWHGHPALDGELLRLKGAYDVLMRKRALESNR